MVVVLTMCVCVVSKGAVEERKLSEQEGWSEGGYSRRESSGSSQHGHETSLMLMRGLNGSNPLMNF